MKIEERREGRVVVLSIEGRLDHAGAEIFDERVSKLIEAGEKALLVDFHGVDFVASMGLRAIIKPYQALAPAGGRIAVANLGDTIHQVFRMAGIDQAVPIYDSVDEALASF